MTRYEHYQYMWPPRPKQAQPETMILYFEKLGWWAQGKLDGDCCVLAISPEREIIARTRHGDQPFSPQRWAGPGDQCGWLADRLTGGWYVFVAELLQARGVGVKDTLFFHDILVADGDYLVGRDYRTRSEMLARLMGVPFAVREGPPGLGEDWSHITVRPGIWLARSWRTGFRPLWEQRPGKWVEGLVFKDPSAPLGYCAREDSNAGWQAKTRYPSKISAY